MMKKSLYINPEISRNIRLSSFATAARAFSLDTATHARQNIAYPGGSNTHPGVSNTYPGVSDTRLGVSISRRTTAARRDHFRNVSNTLTVLRDGGAGLLARHRDARETRRRMPGCV